ncbi:hypothetical protein KKC32_02170 [Patescibacteria group bacterium]|nr:hypothetical protein [Patescibacteria group bacterium]
MTTANKMKKGVERFKQCTRMAEDTYDCSAMKLSGACEPHEPANCENSWELNNEVISPIFANCNV